jgi:hypothetical protein
MGGKNSLASSEFYRFSILFSYSAITVKKDMLGESKRVMIKDGDMGKEGKKSSLSLACG